MVRLIVFEYRKHFLKLSIMIGILSFTLISALKIYSIYSENSSFSRGRSNEQSEQIKHLYLEFYKEFEGDITIDKINRLMAIFRPLEIQIADRTASTRTDNPDTYTGNLYSDYQFFHRCFVMPMEYEYMYKGYAYKVASLAQENINFYMSLGNTYDAMKNGKITRIFLGREIKQFAFTEMYQYYLHYDYSSILVFLICVYGLVGVFVSEKESDMDMFILTTKYGGRRTIVAKFLSSAIYIVAVCTWFWLVDLLMFSLAFGSFEGREVPLYAVKNFTDTSLNLTLGQYSLFSNGIKTVGMLALGFGVLLLSSLFRNTLFPFTFSLIGAFGLIYWQEVFTGSGYLWLKVLNPFLLMISRELFYKVEFINFLGYPVLSYVIAIVLAVLYGITFAVILMITVNKNKVI